MGELIFNVFMLVFFVIMLITSGSIEIWDGNYWARYWPMILLVFAVLLFTIKVYQVAKGMKKEDFKFKMEIFALKDKGVQKLLMAFAWLLIYATSMQFLGFIVATLLFCVGMQYLLGKNFSAKTALNSLGITVLIYAIFVWGLGVSVPRGAGFLYDIGITLEYLWS